MKFEIIQGDCLDKLKDIENDIFDACLTDPPYALTGKSGKGGFMGKDWDKALPPVAVWKEVLRTLKPGAYLLAYGGPRTYHRLTCNIEDAGFIIRDCLNWMYSQGFPKGLNIEKATKNDEWKGYNTQLKPAWEPVVLAQKPLDKTYKNNVAKWGCGALNIDACRIGEDKITTQGGNKFNGKIFGIYPACKEEEHEGRCPSNLIVDEEVSEALGQFSRYFYCAKAGKKERNEGLNDLPDAFLATMGDGIGAREHNPNEKTAWVKNNHPTVKPLWANQYLATLIRPPKNGKLLVPYSGSGSEIIGGLLAGWTDVTGIEREEQYIAIAKKRIEYYMKKEPTQD